MLFIINLFLYGVVVGLNNTSIPFQLNCKGIELSEVTVPKILKLYEKKKLTPRELTDCYLKQIEKLNPRYRAVIRTNPDALDMAEDLEILMDDKRKQMPLFGIPVLIQDDFATHDNMKTTAGTESLIGFKPNKDADFVTVLRDAGAILIGKTNLSELSGLRYGYKNQGSSFVGGTIINPYNKKNPVFGVSGGAAVAIATNMATVAFATSMYGSTSGPTSAMKVFGFSPTKGHTLPNGLIPNVGFMNNIIFITRNLEDSSYLLKAIKPRKPHKFSSNQRPHTAKPFQFNNLPKGLNVGVLDEPYFKYHEVKKQYPKFKAGFNFLNENGAKLHNLELGISKEDIEAGLAGLPYYLDKFMFNYLDKESNYQRGFTTTYSIYRMEEQFKPENNEHHFLEYLKNYLRKPDAYKRQRLSELTSLERRLKDKLSGFILEHQLHVIAIPSQPETLAPLIPALINFPTLSIPVASTTAGNFGLTLFTLPGNDALLFEIAQLLMAHFKKEAVSS